MILETSLAMRGKGGAFAQWGLTPAGDNTESRALSSFLVAGGLSLYLARPEFFGFFAVLWWSFILFTPHWNFRTIDHPSPWMRVLWIIPSAVRMSLILPLLELVAYCATGSLIPPVIAMLYTALLMAGSYFLGGVAQRTGATRDAVVFAETLCGAVIGTVLLSMLAMLPENLIAFLHHLTAY